MVVSAFADKETTKGDKKTAKRGLSYLGYGGYSAPVYGAGLGYSSGLGHTYGGAQSYSSLGYSGLGHTGYVASAPVAAAHYVQPHTHTHSVETKVVAQPYPVVQTQVVEKHVPQVCFLSLIILNWFLSSKSVYEFSFVRSFQFFNSHRKFEYFLKLITKSIDILKFSSLEYMFTYIGIGKFLIQKYSSNFLDLGFFFVVNSFF